VRVSRYRESYQNNHIAVLVYTLLEEILDQTADHLDLYVSIKGMLPVAEAGNFSSASSLTLQAIA
jgi:hypothetical protein